MLRNMTVYGGVIFSQQVMLALVAAGLSREEAYALVQHHAHTPGTSPVVTSKPAWPPIHG